MVYYTRRRERYYDGDCNEKAFVPRQGKKITKNTPPVSPRYGIASRDVTDYIVDFDGGPRQNMAPCDTDGRRYPAMTNYGASSLVNRMPFEEVHPHLH